MEYWRLSSLVPGYMTASWTVSPPAVGVRATCGVEGRPAGGGEGKKVYVRMLISARHILPMLLTKERPDCGVDPHCSEYVGQGNVKGVLCAGLQSHDVEETAIPCNLIGRVEGAINKDPHLYGRVVRFGQVELHSCTAHWDVSGAQFSGGSSGVGRGCSGQQTMHMNRNIATHDLYSYNMNSCIYTTHIHTDHH